MASGVATSAQIGVDTLLNVQNIAGSTANDTFVASANNVSNQFDGGVGTDTIDFSALVSALNIQGFNSVNNTFQSVTGSGATAATSDQIRHIENVIGGQGGNIITVNDNVAHLFTGGAGIDQFTFGAGNDTVIATVDNVRDVYNGGNGTNTADYSAYVANLSVNLGTGGGSVVGSSGSTAANSDTLVNFQNFRGGSGNDAITGSDANNVLEGGRGDDILVGGRGADSFVFDVTFGRDHIADFVAAGTGHDLIDLSAALGVSTAAQALAAAHDVGGHAQLTFGTNTIDLDGVRSNQLIADDFRIH